MASADFCAQCLSFFGDDDAYCRSCGRARSSGAAAPAGSNPPTHSRQGQIPRPRNPPPAGRAAATSRPTRRWRPLPGLLGLVTAIGLAVGAGAVVISLRPPPEMEMLSTAQDSVVTVNVVRSDLSKVSGSGFYVGKDGRLITAAHVVATAWKVEVTNRDGSRAIAALVGENSTNDVAELLVTGSTPPLTTQTLRPRAGTKIFVLGNPGGNAPNTSVPGKVLTSSGTSNIEGVLKPDLVELDVGANHGDSGGPVIDEWGRVLAVLTAASSNNRASALPVDRMSEDLRSWSSLPGRTIAPPAPQVQLSGFKFNGLCDAYRGCTMQVTATNTGGPAFGRIDLEVSEEFGFLGSCSLNYTLDPGTSQTASCTANSAQLAWYFDNRHGRIRGVPVLVSANPGPLGTT